MECADALAVSGDDGAHGRRPTVGEQHVALEVGGQPAGGILGEHRRRLSRRHGFPGAGGRVKRTGSPMANAPVPADSITLQERLDPSVVVDELYGNRQAGEGVREPQRPERCR